MDSSSVIALFEAWSSCYRFIFQQLSTPILPEQPTTQFAPVSPVPPRSPSPAQLQSLDDPPVVTQLTLFPPGTSDAPEGSLPKRPRLDPPQP